jgi:anti-anti-sigma regulatory factor
MTGREMVTVDKKQLGDGSLHLTVAGKIDEKFESMAPESAPSKVVVHLGGVRSISSLGVRAFENFVAQLGDHDVELIHVSAAIASQITMIPNLCQNAKVVSAKLPFTCPACGNEKNHSVPWKVNACVDHAPTCECGAKMDLDGLPEQYLPS